MTGIGLGKEAVAPLSRTRERGGGRGGFSLLVDIGNSRLKWAGAEGEALTGQACVRYEGASLASTLDGHWADRVRPGSVLVASVRDSDVTDALRRWVSDRWDLDAQLVVPDGESHGVSNAYTEPGRLGADRWAALIAARHLHHGPACIVDCGTAVTVDALAGNGEHLGGLILPGLTMMRRSLTERTDGIGEAVSGEVSLLARNTADGVTAGTLYTLVAAIDRIVADVGAEIGKEVVHILTGGDGETVLPLLAGTWEHEPDLVLRGLAVIARG